MPFPPKHDEPSNTQHDKDDFTSSNSALVQIRARLDKITRDYADGRLNATQFNALYAHYAEKRQIIEKLLERDPDTDAWRNVAAQGHTMRLRARLESRAVYYVVLRRGDTKPLLSAGKLTEKTARQVHQMLKVLWRLQTWSVGMVRKSLGGGLWLLLVTGKHSMTLAVYAMQPSPLQVNHLRDLQADFEHANQIALEKGEPAQTMVFPQRALLE